MSRGEGSVSCVNSRTTRETSVVLTDPQTTGLKPVRRMEGIWVRTPYGVMFTILVKWGISSSLVASQEILLQTQVVSRLDY